MSAELASRILDALPQTQCTRCGFPDCGGYAEAIASGVASINQCPPGGQEGIFRLSRITSAAVEPLDPVYGREGSRGVMFIDENWCIGCTLCIDVCPTDAIVGSNKRMHTIMEQHCTGCELCLPVCPVDCIKVENVSNNVTGWAAWSQPQAELARERYEIKKIRGKRSKLEHSLAKQTSVETKLADLASHSQITDPQLLARKRAIIEAALTRARAKAQPG